MWVVGLCVVGIGCCVVTFILNNILMYVTFSLCITLYNKARAWLLQLLSWSGMIIIMKTILFGASKAREREIGVCVRVCVCVFVCEERCGPQIRSVLLFDVYIHLALLRP